MSMKDDVGEWLGVAIVFTGVVLVLVVTTVWILRWLVEGTSCF